LTPAACAGALQVDGKVVMAEFDGAAVSSPGFEDYFNLIPLELLEEGMVASNYEEGMVRRSCLPAVYACGHRSNLCPTTQLC
jgi:hypothetical protein